jgi:hypothetical protein
MPTKRRIDAAQAMAEAEAALTRACVGFERKTDFHIKVENFNFWPSSGKIGRDNDWRKCEQVGLAIFLHMLQDAGLAKNQPLDTVADPLDSDLEARHRGRGIETL